MIPKLKKNKDGKIEVDGDFKFETSTPVIDDETHDVQLTVSFKLNPEIKQDINNVATHDEITETLAEKIKRDFIKFFTRGK